DVVVDHNTVIQRQASGIVLVDGAPVAGFVFTNNLTRHNDFGIIGGNHGPGLDSIRFYFPGSVITNNVIADAQPRLYPTGNLFPDFGEYKSQFLSYDNGDYRLKSDSAWRRAGTNGSELGADLDAARTGPGPGGR